MKAESCKRTGPEIISRRKAVFIKCGGKTLGVRISESTVGFMAWLENGIIARIFLHSGTMDPGHKFSH